MAGKKSGLGRGLDALFPEKTVQSKPKTVKTVKEEKKVAVDTKKSSQQETSNGERMMKISMIEPNREQPRKKFDEDALQELSESIKQYGILQPLLVSDKKDYYEIVAGERRWRAAKMAGLKEVPVVVKEFSTQEIVEISLIENIQREDLNAIEEAEAYDRLIRDFNLKQDEVAERVSKSRVAITNSLRLLKLDERVREMIIEDKIKSGHARALLGVSDGDEQYKLAVMIFDNSMSVRETEKMVKKYLADKKKPVKEVREKDTQTELIYKDYEEKLKSVIGTKVNINNKGKGKGKIEIEYFSADEFDRIMTMMMAMKQ